MKKIVPFLLIISLMLLSFGACKADREVVMDFGTKDGLAVQNLKKFDSFTSTWAWTGTETGTCDSEIFSVIPALDEIKAESLRFDLFMGYTGLGYAIGRNGADGSSEAEYRQVMELVSRLKDVQVNPYIVYFASPEYVTDGNWKSVPDPEKWETLCYNIANYFKEQGIRISGNEIWNEPDFNGSFFSGDWIDYINTYIAGYKGIKAANSDASVVGMSVAYAHDRFTKKTTVDGVAKTDWQRFVEAVYDNYLPDAISWHYYGREGQISGRLDETENFSWYLDAVRQGLNGYQNGTHEDLAEGVSYPNLETLQQNLNEFNIYQPSVDDIYQTVRMLPGMFYAFDTLLQATDITRVSWAALVGEKNDGLSYDLIDGLSHQRYPAFHALWMYSRLPVDRVKLDLKNDNLGIMAGVDSHRAGAIIYNKSAEKQTVTVKLAGIPFERGDLNVYLVDDEHYSYTTQNAPVMVRQRKNIATNGEVIKLELKPNSAYYIEVNDEGGKSELEYRQSVARLVSKQYYYPERRDNAPYSDVHENSLVAHVGMADNAKGKSAMAVTLDGMKTLDGLTIDYETWGELGKSAESALGLKIEYQTSDGSYKNSTFYYVDGMDYNMLLPLGSKTRAENTVSLGDKGEGSYFVNLKETAPADWTGRIIVTYMIKDAGNGATAKFMLR
ncbi:MAG: hypothetical protein ACI4S9_08235 [Christensenellales bacterium]